MHVSALSYISLGKELSVDEKVDFAHSVVGPAMYQFSLGSYYSESEYSLQGNQWGERFWGRETYNQLLKVRENMMIIPFVQSEISRNMCKSGLVRCQNGSLLSNSKMALATKGRLRTNRADKKVLPR